MQAYKFDLTTGGMIVSSTAAKQTIAFGDDDEDAVNEVSKRPHRFLYT